MRTKEEIKQYFQDLPGHVKEELLDELLREHELSGHVLENVKKDLGKKKKPCPHCGSNKVYKRGKQNGIQQYRCLECKKWYSETTGTPLWDIKLKHKWQSYIRCMEQGMSIKKIAKELNISIQTSFDWRHKILSSLSSFEPEKLSDVVECDEMELPLNNKGCRNLKRPPRKRSSDFKRNESFSNPTVVQVVTAVERNGGKYLKAVESQRLSAKEIDKVLGSKISDNVTLITDKHPSYRSFAKSNKIIKHKTVLAKEYVSKHDKQIHLQHVNKTHAQLRHFLSRFNGVSSKYLQNYLNWFAYAGKLEGTKTIIKQWLLTILTSSQAYELFWLFKDNAVIIRT